jgi:hypothetical protein
VRRAQDDAARRSRRVNGRPWMILAVLGGIVVLAAAAVEVVTGSSAGRVAPALPPSPLPGELTGPEPWPRNVADLRARLDALGLPALSREGTALHIHEHHELFVNGRRVTVPAGIGINEVGGFISPLHTHDETGIIHVESPVARAFTLGQFFGVWGVRLTPRCLGGYCATGASRVRVYTSGRLFAGDPRRLELVPHQEIVVAYGTTAQLPRPIPSRYAFPAGL